jgi:hypothetical protein
MYPAWSIEQQAVNQEVFTCRSVLSFFAKRLLLDRERKRFPR